MVQRYTQQIGFTKFINQIDHMKFLLTPNQNQIQIFDSDSDLPKNIFNLELEMIIELAGKQKEHFSPYPHNYYSESELFNQNDRFYIYKLPSILKLNLDNLKFFVMQSQCQICHTALFQISQGFILFQFYYKVFYLNVIDNMMNEIFYQQSKLIDKFKVEDESQNIFLKESNHHLDLNILNKSNYELKVEDNSKSQNLFQNQYPIIEKQTELSFHQVKNLNQPSKSIKYKIVNNTKVNQQEFNQNSFIQVMFLSNEGDEKSQIFNQITQQNQSKYKKKQIEQFTQSSVISEKFIFHDCPIMEFELYEEDKIIPFRDYFSKQSIHFFFIFIQYQRTDTMNKRVLDMIKKLYPLDRQRMAIIVTNWSGDNKQKNEIQLKFNHYQFKQIIFLIQKAQKDEILKEVEYCLLNVQASQQNFQNTVFEVTNNNYIEELANKFCQNSQLPRLRNRENLDRSFYDIENESKKQEDELLDKEILQMKYLQSKKLTLKKGRKNNLGTIKNQQIVQKRIKKQTTRKYKRK